jgi:hypothetical protein
MLFIFPFSGAIEGDPIRTWTPSQWRSELAFPVWEFRFVSPGSAHLGLQGPSGPWRHSPPSGQSFSLRIFSLWLVQHSKPFYQHRLRWTYILSPKRHGSSLPKFTLLIQIHVYKIKSVLSNRKIVSFKFCSIFFFRIEWAQSRPQIWMAGQYTVKKG